MSDTPRALRFLWPQTASIDGKLRPIGEDAGADLNPAAVASSLAGTDAPTRRRLARELLHSACLDGRGLSASADRLSPIDPYRSTRPTAATRRDYLTAACPRSARRCTSAGAVPANRGTQPGKSRATSLRHGEVLVASASLPPCPHCQQNVAARDGHDRHGRQRFTRTDCRRDFTLRSASAFSGYPWPADMILMAVRWVQALGRSWRHSSSTRTG